MKIVQNRLKIKKRGFTLIELLAVIVILAIIALIATPIVLNIINDTKESSVLRSADFYLDGVELSIADRVMNHGGISDGTYNILENGNICLEEYDETTKTCKDNDTKLDNNELIIEVDGEVPTSGTITIVSGGISNVSLNLSNKTVIKNNKGELVYQETPAFEKGKFSSVCKPAEGTEYNTTVGTKYKCKVKEVMEEEYKDGYTFYVLNTRNKAGEIITSESTDKEAVSINLIMDRNINSDGTPVTKAIEESDKDSNGGIYNLVAWINQDNYETAGGSSWHDWEDENNFGPITAMNFLYNATKDWINIPALNYTYNDKEYQGTTEENRSYTSFVSNNGVAIITALAGNITTIGTSDKPLRARMPIFSRTYDVDGNIIAEKGEVSDLKSDESNKYLYYHMALDGCYDNEDDYNPVACEDAGYIEGVYEKGIENIDGISGYWTLSSCADYSYVAWFVDYVGYVHNNHVDGDRSYGVRPVINLKI